MEGPISTRRDASGTPRPERSGSLPVGKRIYAPEVLALVVALLVGGAGGQEWRPRPSTSPHIGGPVSPDGQYGVTCDLPASMRHRNRGGSNGAGLCVFASIDHAALYQNDRAAIGLFQKMFREPGGGWPSKVDAMMRKYCPGALYLQYEGKDPAALELALKTGRMPSITYGPDHMVSLIFLNETWAAVLDNNFVGENEIRWFKRDELLRLWRAGGNGWVVVLLHPRPPAAVKSR